jgi:hypothetical protein
VVVVDVTGAVVEVVVPATEVVVDGVATPTVAVPVVAGPVVTGADVDVVVPATAADRAAAVVTDTASASWTDWAADTCSGGRVGSPGCGSATIGAVGAVKTCSGAERGTAGSVAGSTKGRMPVVSEPGDAAGRVAPR